MTQGPGVINKKERSFSRLTNCPYDVASWLFVSDLVLGLSEAGVRELWVRDEPHRSVNCALHRLCWHSGAMARFFTGRGNDPVKACAFHLIHLVLVPDPIMGSFNGFWESVIMNHLPWRSEGYYGMPYSPVFAQSILERECVPDYAELIRRYARVIRRSLYG